MTLMEAMRQLANGFIVGAAITLAGGAVLYVLFMALDNALRGLGTLLARVVGRLFGAHMTLWAMGMHLTATGVLAFAFLSRPFGPGNAGGAMGSAAVVGCYWLIRYRRDRQLPEPPAGAAPGPPAPPAVPTPPALPAPPAVPAQGRGWRRLAIGSVAAVALVCCCLASLSSWLNQSTPSDAANAWLAATRDGNEARLDELTCAGANSDGGRLALDPAQARTLRWRIAKATRNDNAASVVVVASFVTDGQTVQAEFTLELEREKADWKICGYHESNASQPSP